MTILCGTFIFAVLTAYTIYRYIIIGNDFLGEMTLVHMDWHIIYSFFTIMITFAGSYVKRKVLQVKLQHKIDFELENVLYKRSESRFYQF